MIEELLSGLFGAVLGASVSFLTLRYNYRDLYARNISANRMDWINKFREELSIVIAQLRSKDENNTETNNNMFEAEKARTKLLTRLNMDTAKIGNEYNGVMAELLKNIDFENSSNSPDVDDLIENLIMLARKILEPEWQRVKREAKGK